MRLKSSIAILLFTAVSGAGAQTVRLSGRVVDEAGMAPVRGATVRVTGSDTTMTTGPSGTFSFAGLLPGRMVLTVSAVGRQFKSIPLEIYADTVVDAVMRPMVVTLDPMVVRPGGIRIKGTAVDSATGEYLWFALAGLYPAEVFYEASNGDFRFDKVAPGPVTIVVEAAEHLPAVIHFNARRDTTLRVKLAIDSVAIRMIGHQVLRLTERAASSPYVVLDYGRKDMERQRTATVGEFIDRQLFRPPGRKTRGGQSADDACVFLDDRKIAPGMLDGILSDLVERVELYRKGEMIRVYSRKYVRSLIAKDNLPKATFIPTGLRPACE